MAVHGRPARSFSAGGQNLFGRGEYRTARILFLSLQQKKPSSLSLSGNRRRRHINSALPLLLLQKAASRSQLPAFDPVNVLPCNGGTPVLTTGKTFTRTADRRGHLEPVATFHQWRLSGNRLTLNVMSCSLHLHVELLPFQFREKKLSMRNLEFWKFVQEENVLVLKFV